MWHRSSTSSVHLVVLLVLSNAFVGVRAVFTGTPVFLRWARVEETAALFANNTPNTEIFHEPIQKAAEQALVVRCLLQFDCGLNRFSQQDSENALLCTKDVIVK